DSLVATQCLAGLRHDGDDDLLALLLVRQSVQRPLLAPRDLVELLPDFSRPDLAARHVDPVPHPTDDVDVAVLVHAADDAGMEPAAAQGALAFLGKVPVALHHARPANDHLSPLAAGQFPISLVEDRKFEALDRAAH